LNPEPAPAIAHFLKAARRPVLLEPGDQPLPITAENFLLNCAGNTVTLECWTDYRNLVRRVRGLRASRRGRLELEVERFGGRTGTLLLLDLAEPSSGAATRHGVRLEYRERFRRSLRRQFPDWKLVELSTEPDLHHSLSPSYARAFLRKGATGWAAIGASENCLEPDGVLSFGLIWLDHLRRRERRIAIEGLAVFLPSGAESATCHRVRYLNPSAARYAVFVQGPEGFEHAVNPGDYTNFETRLEPFRQPLWNADTAVAAWVDRIAEIPGIDRLARPDGSVSLAVNGLEFARTAGSTLLFGIEERHRDGAALASPGNFPEPGRDRLRCAAPVSGDRHAAGGERHLQEIENLARGLLRMRNPDADRANPLYQRHPEAWLESQVRRFVDTLDATLYSERVYSQAPHMAAGDRGVVDLLAAGRDGRLAVIEIKATQDIHLPLQALDYWMRVRWHLDRGEFAAQGYFPGISVRPDPPRLLLVAPALDFHPTNEGVLRYFSPEVQAERIGVGLEWRREIRVMFRSPACQWPSQSYAKSGKL
jgi:hypothetical protein